MTIPSLDDVRSVPLTDDESVRLRVADLLGRALRHQLWLMLIDADACQLPLLVPFEVPPIPADDDAEPLADLLREAAEACDAASAIIAFERPGRDALTRLDREWLRVAHDAARLAGIPLRGPLLAHSRGVRWVAPEDYLLS